MIKVNTDMDEVVALDIDSFERCDLSKSSLHRALLFGQTFREVLFEEANLRCGTFENAEFLRCDFRKAVLVDGYFGGAEFRDSNLSSALCKGARFDFAKFYNVDFSEADVSRCSFRGAVFVGCNLVCCGLGDADLTVALFDENTVFPGRFDPVSHGAIERWKVIG